MRLVLAFILRNWPLKLGAVFLATVLYAGLVLAQNTRTFPAHVPIEPVRPPANASLLTSLPDVTLIRYRAPIDVAGRISNDDFHASVDLSKVVAEQGGTPVTVSVTLVAVNPRIEVIDWEPRRVTVRLDPVLTKTFPVTISRNGPPPGLTIGLTQIQPSIVSASGASSLVLSIRRIEGRVTIDASGINVDTDVDLQALDDRGEVVPQVEITPPRVHVKIDVAKDLANRSVPVVPHLVGTPPAGYRVQSVTVRPLVVTLSGERPVVAAIEAIDTLAIDVTGQTGPFDARVGLDLPTDVSVAGPSEVAVSVVIGPDSGTRTFEAGVGLVNVSPSLVYAPSVPKALVTLGGPLPVLDSIDPRELLATVDVQGLGPGTHDVLVRVKPPVGSQVVAIAPPRITVVVTEPPPTPSPEPTPSVSPSPSTSPAVSPTGTVRGPRAQV